MTATGVTILGTAQDGGLPHVGCRCDRCERARREPAFARRVACAGVHDGATDRRMLIDATPDLPAQWLAFGRPDEIWLTHAHTGHYAGLLHLGRETMNVRGLRLRGTASMIEFLRDNAPWSWLLESGALVPVEVRPGVAFRPAPDLEATPIAVPHRAEHTDTVGFEIRGPRGALFYAPDTDGFAPWAEELEAIATRVDTIVIDGTFWSRDEIPGRDPSEIPHPFISEEQARLRALAERCNVLLTHLNHTNPLADPDSAARRALTGATVASDGQVVPL